jgi:hypothetical protein
LVAAAIAALVTVVPEWTRAAYTQADTKQANEKNLRENIASARLSDFERLSIPALIPNSDPVPFKFLPEPGRAYTDVAAAPSLDSSFARGEGLLFLAEPMGSRAPGQNGAYATIRGSEQTSIDSADDVTPDTSLPVQTASVEPDIDIPLPHSRPIINNQARNQSSRSNDSSTVAGTRQTASFAWLKKLFPFLGRGTPVLPADADSQTAVYDIEDHVVYLPNGEKLEAHSGLSKWLDDPRYVNIKGRGPTPPNTYRLALREKPFHGVQAIRLNPVGDGNMYGRAGMLAHPYMLGPNGESNGCVSVQNYPKFLQAFLKGDINRLIVVARLDRAPSTAAYGQVNLAAANSDNF